MGIGHIVRKITECGHCEFAGGAEEDAYKRKARSVSGARILTTLLHEMRRRDEIRYGLATMCIGVGHGISMVVERPV
jgi:hypothetical protein